jgi:hypothetical protein
LKQEPLSKWKMKGTMNEEEIRMNKEILKEISTMKKEGTYSQMV